MNISKFYNNHINFNCKIAFFLFFTILTPIFSYSSHIPKGSDETKNNIPERFIKKIEHKSARLNKRVQKAKKKYLHRLNKDENRMQKKLCKLNPALSDYLFRYPLNTNLELRKKLRGDAQSSSEYFAMLDSMDVAVKFFEETCAGSSEVPLNEEQPVEKKQRLLIDRTKKNINDARITLNEMSGIQQYLRTRKKQLNSALGKYPEMSEELKEYDKSTYYFREQVNEYKNIFKDPSHIEEKVFGELKKDNSFGSYMRKNSELSEVFSSVSNSQSTINNQQLAINNLPSVTGNSQPDVSGMQSAVNGTSPSASGLSSPVVPAQTATQLQTISQTEDMIQKSIKEMGPNAKEVIANNMGEMHTKMAKLKYDFPNLTNPADIPSFKPSTLKTKRLVDRIEYGMNFQFGSVNYFFPSSVNAGLQIAYKITMRSSAGVGASYNLGLGKRWDDIKFTNEGFGLRSFLDYQIKGLLFLHGGFEKNYHATLPILPHPPIEIKGLKAATPDRWTASALLGVKLKHKINKKSYGTMSLMYDFLREKNTPSTPALVYRAGWEW